MSLIRGFVNPNTYVIYTHGINTNWGIRESRVWFNETLDWCKPSLFSDFWPRLYGPGPSMLYGPGPLILYGPGPLIIGKKCLSQMLQDHIWNAHAPGSCFNMLLEHVHFKYGPGAFDLENSFRSLMVQDHIILMVQDHTTLRRVKWVTLVWLLFGVHPY